MDNKIKIESIVGNEFSPKAVEQINKAVKSIKIIVFDWRWYPTEAGTPMQNFNQSILNAKKRGLQVQIITNNQGIVKTFIEQGINAKQLKSKRLLHVKLMIIDDKHIITGSHNYTQNAMTINYEFSFLIYNCPQIERCLKFFNNLFYND